MASEKFEEFYRETYLHEHTNRTNRWIHFLSNLSVLTCLSAAAVTQNWLFLAGAAFSQLVPPFLGHVFFEGSHQSVERSPLFSAMGSWRMFFDIIRGREKL